MKPCEEYESALSAFLDGELSEAEQPALRAHLADCPACRAYLAELTQLHEALGEEIEPPERLDEHILNFIYDAREREHEKKRRGAWLRGMAAAAVAAVFVGVILPRALPRMGKANTAEVCEDSTAGIADEEESDGLPLLFTAPLMQSAAPESAAPDAPAETPEASCVTEESAVMPEAASDKAAEKKTILGMQAGGVTAPNENANDLARSVVFVYGASKGDYLFDAATSVDRHPDGSVAGYDLPVGELSALLAALDADGLAYDVSVSDQAGTFLVLYEEVVS